MAHKIDDPAPQLKVNRTRRQRSDPLAAEDGQNPATKTEPTLPEPSHDKLKADQADKIIKNHIIAAAGIALVPMPLIDIAAITALELRMLKSLTVLYEMEFFEHRGKALIASLVSGLKVGLLTASLLKFLPGLGWVGVAAPMAAIAGAITYAVGNIFVQHFESGGTLLDFDPEKVRGFFIHEYKDGRKVALELQRAGNDNTHS
jgi:uncharacterized protein (DUF697 family)